MSAVTRVLAVLLLYAVLAREAGHSASRASAAGWSRALTFLSQVPCHTSLTLTLQPGQHWPGSASEPVPSDLPPGPVGVAVPVYPDAVQTQETETVPSFTVPGVDYMKSASVTYHAPAGIGAVQSWYEGAFKACGYSLSGTQQSGKSGVQLSQGIVETRKQNGDWRQIDLSFASARDGGTLVLYVAIVITPPLYPVAGSVPRVPGRPVQVSITQYAGMNPGPRALRPRRSVTVRSAAIAASLADEINHLPKPLGRGMSCPMDDGSHDTLVFRDADGSIHPVYLGLRGCQVVLAPPAPPGRLFDDPHLLPRINALLRGPGSARLPYPYDARTLRPRTVRPLGASPGRFLSTGQNGSHLLYLSRAGLFMGNATGGTPRLLATDVVDASFTIDDLHVLARPRTSRDLSQLLLIDTRTGKEQPFHLPAGAALVGRVAGIGAPGLADALTCDLQDVWFTVGRRVAGIDLEHPDDRFRSAPFLPAPGPGRLMAISCSGVDIAVYQPGRGLTVRQVDFTQGGGGRVLRRVPVRDVSFLSWAPDDRHLAYRTGGALFALDAQTGARRLLLRLGRDVVHGAAWDPWSHVIALSVTSPGTPTTGSRIVLADVDGTATGRLPGVGGATRLDWSVWRGETLGVTRVTPDGAQAWAVSLPALPLDPACCLGNLHRGRDMQDDVRQSRPQGSPQLVTHMCLRRTDFSLTTF